MPKISRRNILAGLGGSLLLPGLAAATPPRKRVLRVAHLTDIHVIDESGAPEGMAMAFRHAQRDKPDLILTGGDMIMDALNTEKAAIQQQWDIFNRVLKENLKTPIRHCIGNHDVFGWEAPEKYASEAKYGKVWAMEQFGLTKPYYSFDQGGWHFIVLDSIYDMKGGYSGRLDDAQFEWLQGDLKATPAKTPVLVVSHIPIVGACAYFDGPNEKTGTWVVPAALMHSDARRIKDLFLKHPNVKVCLSGHEHLRDDVLYNGVHYICDGAVCAKWWGGDYQECTYGYGRLDLYDDGTFDHRYVTYGWKTRG
ncbi:MAG: metallophosphoesterase family protein [Fimbriimonas sp.]